MVPETVNVATGAGSGFNPGDGVRIELLLSPHAAVASISATLAAAASPTVRLWGFIKPPLFLSHREAAKGVTSCNPRVLVFQVRTTARKQST
jgi:hypothetical protein